MIPNVVHFIFGLKEDFGGKPFSFIHYLAIKSAHERLKPDAIKFYYKYEPQGPWWDASKEYLTLVKVEPPREIFGHPLLHYAHQADVLRLEILMKQGGIYLDVDVLCLNSFGPLLKYQCVMGMEENLGLCNAVILAAPGAPFIRAWYDSYRTFRSKGRDEFWNEHSVLVPLRLARRVPGLIQRQDKYAFFWPNYHEASTAFWSPTAFGTPDTWLARFKRWTVLNFISNSYCVHLWEGLWWEPYLKDISPESIADQENIFSKLCRNELAPRNPILRKISFVFRPVLKSIISTYARGQGAPQSSLR